MEIALIALSAGQEKRTKNIFHISNQPTDRQTDRQVALEPTKNRRSDGTNCLSSVYLPENRPADNQSTRNRRRTNFFRKSVDLIPDELGRFSVGKAKIIGRFNGTIRRSVFDRY